MNIRRGVTAGVIIALFLSVMVGVNAESFWGPFLTSLVVSVLFGGAATGLLVLAKRGRTSE